MFTLEEKLAAVKLVRGGMSYRQASRVCGASYHSVWKWHRALDGGVRGLYALVDHRRRPEEMDPVDLDDLPDDPEELKRIIRDQQFEIDITKAVMEIVKKRPRRRPEVAAQQGQGGPGRRPGEDAPTVFDQLSGFIASSRTSDFLLSQEEDRRGSGSGAEGEGGEGLR